MRHWGEGGGGLPTNIETILSPVMILATLIRPLYEGIIDHHTSMTLYHPYSL
jgi:hypothetical protein